MTDSLFGVFRLLNFAVEVNKREFCQKQNGCSVGYIPFCYLYIYILILQINNDWYVRVDIFKNYTYSTVKTNTETSI